MTSVKVHQKSLIARIAAYKLHEKSVAVTIGKRIYLYGITKEDFFKNKDWVCHELAHVEQYEQYGFLKFLFLYLKESFRKGYHDNKLEQEARLRENDYSLFEKYCFV